MTITEHPSVETGLLLRLLGRTKGGGVDWCCGPAWDWRVFADACYFHQVSALAFCRLDSLPKQAVPEALSAHLRDRFYRVSLTNYLLANTLVALTSLLEQEGIPVLAYKGPAVAMAIYGDLALREYQDLDLVVRLEHLTDAIQVMKRAGFQPLANHRPESVRYLQFHHATLHAPDQSHFVELHWRLGGNLWHAFCPEVEKLWSRSETLQLPRGQVSTMCREDLFLVLCFHGTKHRWWCLKWLVDVAELLRSADTWDWSRVEEMTASRPGAAAAASLGLLLAHELLGAPLPTGAAMILPLTERIRGLAGAIRQEILLHGHTDDDPHRTLLALEERLTARMKYRGTHAVRRTRRWFRDVITVSQKDRALVQLPEKLEFLYPCIRLLRLAGKSIRLAALAFGSLARRGPIRKAFGDRL